MLKYFTLVSFFIGAAGAAQATTARITCIENESFDSQMMREANGKNFPGVLQNAKPNDGTGNIGDYVIDYDMTTKKILRFQGTRKTSGLHLNLTRANATFNHGLKKLMPGAFDGECTNCRTHYEFINVVENSTRNSITIKIDNHGLYPDVVASDLSFQLGKRKFDMSKEMTTEIYCDGTVLLKRPDVTTSLENELLE